MSYKYLIICLLISLFTPAMALADQTLAWNGKEIKGWICDGRELKPKMGANFKNTYIFDGHEIKPKMGANSSNTWVYDGRELKRKVGATSQNTWIIEGVKARPKTGANSHNTWNIGNAPILVIAGALAFHLY